MATRKLSRIAIMATTILLTAMTITTGRSQDQGAQPPAQRGAAPPARPVVISPEVLPDHRIAFRILAPQADNVRLQGSDLNAGLSTAGQSNPALPPMEKGDNGVWEATLGPIQPGAYRYNFQVDGVSVIDPRNPVTSESNENPWSLVYVPGTEFMDVTNVPHGAVAAVYYHSAALNRTRRLHVYTPPGYESGKEKYPVFYMLHGASDSDNSWSSVGRAGFILDNLIAGKKVKPMVVVMPAGHTTTSASAARGTAAPPAAPGSPTAQAAPRDEFLEDFVTSIMPVVEKNYRIMTDRSHRAIAGLSMGGRQTLNISFDHLGKFAYIDVFSSGIVLGGGGRGAAPGTAPAGTPAPAAAAPESPWEQQHLDTLENPGLKKGLKLIWFSTGVEDRLIANSRSSVELLRKHGFQVVFKESPGAHTWINWRNYLNEFASQLFR